MHRGDLVQDAEGNFYREGCYCAECEWQAKERAARAEELDKREDAQAKAAREHYIKYYMPEL